MESLSAMHETKNPVHLEPDITRRPMLQRLLDAAARTGGVRVPVTTTLRSDQEVVMERFEELLLDLATHPRPDELTPYWRMVLPPRTGKTVIAAHIIARTGLRATVIVPSRTLVHQVAAELRSQLPGVSVGLWCGTEQTIVASGVNVVTYQIIQTRRRNGLAIPNPVRWTGLVFVDEAHHAMTEQRMSLLDDVFDRRALRVALTATPDFSHTRRLCHHFPTSIAEVGIAEAVRQQLVAPARAWIAEVDVDGSTVRLLAGDYDLEELGALMSSAPFFKAVKLFRYQGENRHRPALICCASRAQAHHLLRYGR